MTDPDFTCEACGPDVREAGAICFLSGEPHVRSVRLAGRVP